MAANEIFGVAVKAGIVHEGKMLVLYKCANETQEDPDPNQRIDLPGGRVEFGESPLEAIRREVLEEVGLIPQVIRPVFVWHYVEGNFQLVGITYYCRVMFDAVILSKEHDRYEWLDEEELQARDIKDWLGFREVFKTVAQEAP